MIGIPLRRGIDLCVRDCTVCHTESLLTFWRFKSNAILTKPCEARGGEYFVGGKKGEAGEGKRRRRRLQLSLMIKPNRTRPVRKFRRRML